jgi:hypothetical protein
MPTIDYRKYVITEPIREAGPKYELKNRMNPSMTYLSRGLIPDTRYYIEFGWIWGLPAPNPHTPEHMHRFNEFVLHLGSDVTNPGKLGAEIEYGMGGIPQVFDTTNCLFVPSWLRHGPLTWTKYSAPHIQMTLTVGTGNIRDGWVDIEGEEARKAIAAEVPGTDYSRYMVRRPVPVAGAVGVPGRQPWQTMMSNELVPGCKTLIQSSWVLGWPSSGPANTIPPNDGDTVVLFIGSDWQHPQELGGEIEFSLGGQILHIDKTAAVLIPRGVSHGALTWKAWHKPHLQLNIFL